MSFQPHVTERQLLKVMEFGNIFSRPGKVMDFLKNGPGHGKVMEFQFLVPRYHAVSKLEKFSLSPSKTKFNPG